MKAKIFLCLFICLFCTASTSNLEVAYAEDFTYLRVMEDNTMLYRTSSLEDSSQNIYFELPKTYFVKFLEQVDEESCRVLYDGIEGFVASSNLQKCYSTPTTPYASNQTLDIVDVCNAVVYSLPSNEAEFVGIIPFNASQIKYWGKTKGATIIEELENDWFYVRYQSFEQGIITGYVYAPLCTNQTEIIPNEEEVLTAPPEKVVETNTVPVASEFQNIDSMLLIVGLSAIALVIIYLLFKPERKRKIAKTAKNSTALPIRKGGYIEKHTENDEFDF